MMAANIYWQLDARKDTKHALMIILSCSYLYKYIWHEPILLPF